MKMMITVGLMIGPTKNFNQGRKNMKRILLIMSLTIAALTISQTAEAFGGKEVEVTKEYIVDQCGFVVGRRGNENCNSRKVASVAFSVRVCRGYSRMYLPTAYAVAVAKGRKQS